MSSPASSWSVLVLSRHAPQAASSRLRTEQYLSRLRAAGARVDVAPFFGRAYLDHLYASGGNERNPKHVLAAYAGRVGALVSARKYSVVWVEKELFPYLPGSIERALSVLRVPYVVDYDDATFHTYDQSSSGCVRTLLGSKLDPLIQGAAAITVGNEYLKRYVERHGASRALLVPTVVDLDRYAHVEAPGGETLRIGWIGTPATQKYLEQIRPALLELAQKRRVQLVTIGAGPGLELPLPSERHAWQEDTEASLLGSVHVGIMPLPDHPWERGKCGYKLIQYMAAGRPVVASPVGVNRTLVRSDVGYLASTEADWISALCRLADNATLRKTMGNRGRMLVNAHYSLSAMGPRVVALLQEVAEKRAPSKRAGS